MMIERGEEWTWYADFGLVEQESNQYKSMSHILASFWKNNNCLPPKKLVSQSKI